MNTSSPSPSFSSSSLCSSPSTSLSTSSSLLVLPVDKLTLTESNVISIAGKALKLDTASNVEKLINEIENCCNLISINFEGNTIGVEAAQLIGLALKKKSSLAFVNFKDIFTGRLKTEIPTALTHLTDGLSASHITELDLSDNAYGQIAIEAINPFFKSSCCKKLTVLRLSNNGIGIEGGVLLADALKHLSCLKVFSCGRNRLENEATMAIANSLALINTLEVLELPQNGITREAMKSIGLIIVANRNLQVLNLNDNTVTPRGVKDLYNALQSARNLKCINFGDCLLKSKGGLELLLALEASQALYSLKELDLSGNEMKGDDVSEFILSCFSSSSINKDIKVDLSYNNFSEVCSNKIKKVLNEFPNFRFIAEETSFDDTGSEDSEDTDDSEDSSEDEESNRRYQEYLEREKEPESRRYQNIKLESNGEKDTKSLIESLQECVMYKDMNQCIVLRDNSLEGVHPGHNLDDLIKPNKNENQESNVIEVEAEVHINVDECNDNLTVGNSTNDDNVNCKAKNEIRVTEDDDFVLVNMNDITQECELVLESALNQLATPKKEDSISKLNQDEPSKVNEVDSICDSMSKTSI